MTLVELEVITSDSGRLSDAESGVTVKELQIRISRFGRLSGAESAVAAEGLEVIIISDSGELRDAERGDCGVQAILAQVVVGNPRRLEARWNRIWIIKQVWSSV